MVVHASARPAGVRAGALAGVAAAALLVGGCTPTTDDVAGPATATPDPLHGLTATLYQTRMDVAVRQVEVRLENRSGSDLTLRSARLVSSDFDAPMSYAKTGSVLTAGRVVDLPVPLSAPLCDGSVGSHVVEVEYSLPDGRTGTLRIPATDETGQIATLHEAECFEEQVRQVAVLTITEPPVVRDLAGGPVADLTVQVEPTGRAGTLRVTRVGSTTLLEQVDPVTGQRQRDGYAVDLTVGGDGPDPAELAFSVVPGRCDAHAVAEDKQGTIFRLQVLLDGQEGQVSVASPTAVTAALYDFVREACGS